MSSSAPRRQLTPEAPDFVSTSTSASAYAYAEAEPSRGDSAGVIDPAQTMQFDEDRSQRARAEGFEQGRQSAQQQLRSELDAALGKYRDEINRTLQQFSLERQSYYRGVEGEVVQLALAIAAKILHREAQLDQHVLAGIVRVTIEKLDTGTTVHLHVHPMEATDWRHYFASQQEGVVAPEVHEDAAIAPGECRIETSLGSTVVGLGSQLKEIETGLADLLAERPRVDGNASSASANPATAHFTPAPAISGPSATGSGGTTKN